MDDCSITTPSAKACDRTGISVRAAAIIARSVSLYDTSKVIDRSQIRRKKEQHSLGTDQTCLDCASTVESI